MSITTTWMMGIIRCQRATMAAMDSGSSVLGAVKDARDARAARRRRAAPALDCASARYPWGAARVLGPFFVHIIRVAS
jgi:hypothetical protein